jgi:hypothetical protein
MLFRTYAGKDEETLRDHLLLILNNHYEGQVVAEAFNKHGKTDLLIKVAGQVLFVAECSGGAAPAAWGRRSTSSTATRRGATAGWR